MTIDSKQWALFGMETEKAIHASSTTFNLEDHLEGVNYLLSELLRLHVLV